MSSNTLGKRTRELEWIDQPQTPDEELIRLFDFNRFLDRWGAGFSPILECLDEYSSRWMPGQTISILNLWCGSGDLADVIYRWARSKKIDVQILAIEQFGRMIHLAKDRHEKRKEITFDIKSLKDPFFLQAQQFDYVISTHTLHRFDDHLAVDFLKKVNLMAKRGIILSDWLRGTQCLWWASTFASLWGDTILKHDAPLAVQRGFTKSEVRKMLNDAGLDYAQMTTHLACRFMVSGERAYVRSAELKAVPGLAGI